MTRPGAATARATIIVSDNPPTRTILRHAGIRLDSVDGLDLDALFNRAVVIVDVGYAPLRRLLFDFAARGQPGTQILGTLTYIVRGNVAFADAFALVSKEDAVTGSEAEWLALTGRTRLDDAVTVMQHAMQRGVRLSTCAVSRGSLGCCVFTPTACWRIPAFRVATADTTGAGDAFAAAVAYGLALRWEWKRIGRFANAVGALSTRGLGAQAALPSLAEVAMLMDVDKATLAQ
jgi:ribokinase